MSERPYCVAAVLVETDGGDEKHCLYLSESGQFALSRTPMRLNVGTTDEPFSVQQAIEWLQHNKLSRILDIDDRVHKACQAGN